MRKKTNLVKFIEAALIVTFFLSVDIQTAFGQWNVSNYDRTGLPKTPLGKIIGNVALWLLSIFGFIAIIGFVISGIIYLTSAGNENMQEQAKRAMQYSIIGVIVGLAGLVVIVSVNYFLGGGYASSNIINNAANSPATGAVLPR